MALTPEQRTLRARTAALARWAKEPPQMSAAQAGLRAKFEAEADPDGALEPAERKRRGECLRRAHMVRMSLRSSRIRAARKAAAS